VTVHARHRQVDSLGHLRVGFAAEGCLIYFVARRFRAHHPALDVVLATVGKKSQFPLGSHWRLHLRAERPQHDEERGDGPNSHAPGAARRYNGEACQQQSTYQQERRRTPPASCGQDTRCEAECRHKRGRCGKAEPLSFVNGGARCRKPAAALPTRLRMPGRCRLAWGKRMHFELGRNSSQGLHPSAPRLPAYTRRRSFATAST
jgi:hypothetical protein